MSINASITTSRIRLAAITTKMDANISSSRIRASSIEFRYTNLNYLWVLDDYFLEDYLEEF